MSNDEIKAITLRFLCNLPLREIHWNNTFNDWDTQELLIKSTILNELNVLLPVKASYQKAFLKFVIKNLEDHCVAVHDIAYDCLGSIVSQPDDSNSKCYKHYLTEQAVVSLSENVQIISEGTTGLSTWQAAVVLSEWCLAHKTRLQDKIVVELGSGLGLVGLTIAFNCQPSKVVLTDCHDKVLEKLSENVDLNLLQQQQHRLPNAKRSNDLNKLESTTAAGDADHDYILRKRIDFDDNSSSVISVLKHAWGDTDERTVHQIGANVILAADVVYDSSLFPELVRCISLFLNQNNNRQVGNTGRNGNEDDIELILVCTERNTETLAEFLELLSAKCKIQEEIVPEQKYFAWSTETPIRLFAVTGK